MTTDLLAIAAPLLDRLEATARHDPELRAQLRELATALLALAAEPVPDPERDSSQPDLVLPSELIVSDLLDDHLVDDEPAAPQPSVVPRYKPPRRVTTDDLPLIEQRLRIKAEATRWVAQTCSYAGDVYNDPDLVAHKWALINGARELPDCYLWMFHLPSAEEIAPALFDDLAGSFDTLAAAVVLVLQVVGDQGTSTITPVQTLEVAAHAQALLRVAAAEVGWTRDRDQQDVWRWLNDISDEYGITPRSLLPLEPSDPRAWTDLHKRVEQISEQLQHDAQRTKRNRQLFGKLRYHLNRIQANPTLDNLHDWAKVHESIDALVDDGVPPSNRDLRSLLLPVCDALPDISVVPRSRQMALVLREIDRFRTLQPNGEQPVCDEQESRIVQQAAALLEGRAIVMIGGDRRPHAQEALISALGLSEIIWIETREHQTHTVFEPYVARPDVVLVLLAIRWAGHGFGEVKAFCEKYAKPLVRLPGGYNTNQVAHQIVNQVGEQLAGDVDDPA